VAREAARLGLPLLKPERPSDPAFLERARALAPDAVALVAYGHLIPPALLDLPPRGAWNVHPSLLPRWRGPAPIHRALLAGDAETGVAVMRMVPRLDAGPVALLERTPIGPAETRGELEARLAATGARLLAAAFAALERGALPEVPQEEAAATHAPVIAPADAELRWERPAAELDRLVRALAPAPGAWFACGDARVKVLAARPGPSADEAAPGMLLARLPDGVWRVACGAGGLDVLRVQPAGKVAMRMHEFVIGRRLRPGQPLSPPPLRA